MQLLTKALALSCLVTIASLAGNPELKPYGFVQGQAIYATQEVHSFAPSNPVSVSATLAGSGDESTLGFTAQNTRFGFVGTTEYLDYTIGAKIEVDFWSIVYNTNTQIRMRQAYVWLAQNPGLDLRIGQMWDIYSPRNAQMENLQNNFYQAGNKGFRRPQIQLHYALGSDGITPAIMLSVGEATKESKPVVGDDNRAALPGLYQGRIEVGLGAHSLGGSVAYASHKDTVGGEYETLGFGTDFKVGLGDMGHLVGEFNMGKNLGNVDMFSLANGNAAGDAEIIGFWLNAFVKVMPMLHLSLGGGYESVTSDVAAGGLESNINVFETLIIPVGPLSLSLEHQLLMTSRKGSEEADMAQLISFSGKVGF